MIIEAKDFVFTTESIRTKLLRSLLLRFQEVGSRDLYAPVDDNFIKMIYIDSGNMFIHIISLKQRTSCFSGEIFI